MEIVWYALGTMIILFLIIPLCIGQWTSIFLSVKNKFKGGNDGKRNESESESESK